MIPAASAIPSIHGAVCVTSIAVVVGITSITIWCVIGRFARSVSDVYRRRSADGTARRRVGSVRVEPVVFDVMRACTRDL